MAKRKSSKNLSMLDAVALARENHARLAAQDAEHAAAEEAEARALASPGQKRKQAQSAQRTQQSLYLKPAQLAEIRAAVLDLRAQGERPSNISEFVEGALDREIKRLRRQYRNGEPWPNAPAGTMPPGRPRKP